MPSPFPGMDPYLESPRFWPDFHALFIAAAREMLMKDLPRDYSVLIDERINLIEVPPANEKTIRPNIAITVGIDSAHQAAPGRSEAVATIEPVTIPLPAVEELRETRIEIRHEREGVLIAVLELLSPSNKTPGSGHGEYLAKRTQLIAQRVHLIELDLLLGGQRLPLAQPLPRGNYYGFPYCEVYAWSMRHPLPRIPIPLRSPDPDSSLDLASVFSTTYERAGYDRLIDYGRPPAAPIPEGERQWVAQRAASGAQAG